MIEQDFTLVIQGPMHRNLITMCLLHPHIYTILSIWDDPKWTHPTIQEYLEPIRRDNLELYINSPPKQSKLEKVYNVQNRYLQFLSTHKGMSKVQTKYAIKVRSDEYYSDLSPIMRMFLLDDNKLVTNDVFFRRISYLRYHPSDHIMVAKTEKFKKLLELLMYDCEYNQNALKYAPFNQHDFFLFVEQQIGIKWVELHERNGIHPYKIPSEYEEVKELMIKYFDIVSCSMLGDYYIVANSEKRTYINSQGYYDEAKDIIHSLEEL